MPQADMTQHPGLNNILQRAREELLDLSARNRLINTPRDSARGKKLDIVEERSEDVFRLLVRERKAMSFLPGKGDDPSEAGDGPVPPALSQPDEEKPAEGTVNPPTATSASRHASPRSGCKPGCSTSTTTARLMSKSRESASSIWPSAS